MKTFHDISDLLRCQPGDRRINSAPKYVAAAFYNRHFLADIKDSIRKAFMSELNSIRRLSTSEMRGNTSFKISTYSYFLVSSPNVFVQCRNHCIDQFLFEAKIESLSECVINFHFYIDESDFFETLLPNIRIEIKKCGIGSREEVMTVAKCSPFLFGAIFFPGKDTHQHFFALSIDLRSYSTPSYRRSQQSNSCANEISKKSQPLLSTALGCSGSDDWKIDREPIAHEGY